MSSQSIRNGSRPGPRTQREYTDYKAVNEAHVAQIHTAVNESEIMSQVFSLLQSEVFRGNITARMQPGKKRASKEFEELLNGPWRDALQMAMREMLMYGMFVLLYEDDSIRVLPMHRFVVKFLEIGVDQRDYQVFLPTPLVAMPQLNAMLPIPSTRVFVLLEPENDGRVNSTCSRVLQYLESLRHYFVNYEQILSLSANPAYVITSREGKFMEATLTDNMMAMRPASEQNVGIEGIEAEGVEFRQARNLEAFNHAYGMLQRSSAFEALRDPQTGIPKESYMARKPPIVLPMNQDVTHMPFPQAPSELEKILEWLLNQILLPFNLNVTWVYARFHNQTSSIEASREMRRRMDMAVHHYHKDIAGILKLIYYDVYGESHEAYAQGIVDDIKRSNVLRRPMTDLEVRRVVELSEVEFSFDSVPVIDLESLQKLWELELIDQDQLQRYAYDLFHITDPLGPVNPARSYNAALKRRAEATATAETPLATPPQKKTAAQKAKEDPAAKQAKRGTTDST